MSLDLWMCNPCDKCGNLNDREGFNYTYNVSKMWYEILPNSKGMVDIDDLTGKQAIPILELAIDQMCAHKDKFIGMNPDNGCGSYDGFLAFLRKLLAESQDNPDYIWRADR